MMMAICMQINGTDYSEGDNNNIKDEKKDGGWLMVIERLVMIDDRKLIITFVII